MREMKMFAGGAFLAGLVLVLGCSGPITPTPSARTSIPIPTPSTSFIEPLPLTGPSRTFVFERELSYPVDAATKSSRWVLYDNGAYEHQHGGLSSHGVYRVEDGVFSVVHIPASQAAVYADFAVLGSLEGDVLTIDWDEIAEESGWQDAVYVLRP